MRYSYKLIKNYIVEEVSWEEILNYLNILGLNTKIIKSEEDDVIFELEIPANRPDLLSFSGIVKEILPFGDFSFKNPVEKFYEEEIPDFFQVEIEDFNDCPYYSCQIIRDIKNISSSPELKKIIENIGFRSSFAVVDISNLVMAEIGQPLHIFDLDKIEGKIIIRRGKKGEKIITIDGKERDVENVLIIADKVKPIAIAGIMGGINTEVNHNTKNILIESALFNPVVVRRGSKKVGLSTEASLRFEKGLSISTVKIGMEKAVSLIKNICGGKIGKLNFAGDQTEFKKEIFIEKRKIEKILGIKVDRDFVKKIFFKRDFIIEEKENGFICIIPEYRKDIKEDIDLIEEIAKYIKYSEIPSELPYSVIRPSFSDNIYFKIFEIKNILVNLGFFEVISLSFISERIKEILNLNAIRIENPLSQNFGFLRNSLIFNLLEIISFNVSHQVNFLEIFEIGKVYNYKNGNYNEEERTACVSLNSGTFFDFKGKIEKLIEKFNFEIKYKKEEFCFAEKGGNLSIYYLGEKIGNIFLLSEELKKIYEIEGKIYVCEIFLDKILKDLKFEKKFKQLPKLPFSKRDFSFIFPEEIEWEEVFNAIISTGFPIESIEVFDIYKGKKIPDEKISVSFSVIFRSKDKTLESEEIEFFSKKITEMIEEKFFGKLRGKCIN